MPSPRRPSAAARALVALVALLACAAARAARLPLLPVAALPVFTSHETAAAPPLRRSGERPNPTKIHSCSQWMSIYERHWQQYPDCHAGQTNTICCELYDMMDKSIRIFNNQLQCKVTNMAFYQRKFSKYCVNGGIASTHTTATTTPTKKPADLHLKPPVTVDGSHGTGQITILEEQGSTHTGVCSTPDCCSGQSCCTSCATTTTTTVSTECTTPDCITPCQGHHCNTTPCTGQHCSTPCTGQHCSTACTGQHCATPCVGVHCNTAQPNLCQVGVNCAGVCVNNRCVGVAQQTPQPQPNPNTCQVGVNCAGLCVNNRCVGGGRSGNDDDDDDNVCFHPENSVHLADGTFKPMHKLAVGDRVHVSPTHSSVVFMFTHRDASIRASFVNLTVHSGHHIIVTPSHFMYGTQGAVEAGKLRVGAAIQMSDGRFERITSVSTLAARGLYNPQTMHGDISVSGFRASTFTRAVEKHTAHALMAPLRALYRISGGAHISALF